MKYLMALSLALVALFAFGCDNDDNSIVEVDAVPATPQGVYSVTGDGQVWVFWNGIYDTDVDFYRVYRSLDATSGYTAIADVDAVPNPNLDLLIYEYIDAGRTNGVTYWYAVTAVDKAGQESELSAEDVFDTPRPEDNGDLLPADVAPGAAGFNLQTGTVVNWNSVAADIWVDRVVDTIDNVIYVFPYINAGIFTDGQTDIQDMGYTSNFDEISYAPVDGWSLLGYAEAIEGHTYVIWTSDDHYAKVRINSISPSGAVSFRFAYQTAESNLELAPPQRPERDDDEGPLSKNTVVTELLK